MNKNFFSVLKRLQWLYPLPIAMVIALLFLKHTLLTFIVGSLILYGISLLFLYRRARWLLFFAFSMLPMLLITLLSENGQAFSLVGQLSFWLVFLACLILGYLLARKWEIIPKPTLKAFPIGTIAMGFLFLLLASYGSGIVGQLTNSATTENQAAIDSLFKNIPVSVFAANILCAGFFEELAFRAGMFELVFKKNKYLAFVAAFLVFALLHSPTDLYSWFTYGTMSLVLTGLYAKYRNFYLNMSVHVLWNAFGLFFIILSSLL